jgi:hypothetical protein
MTTAEGAGGRVSGGDPARCRPGRGFVGAGGDAGVAPPLAGQRHELPALGGRGPGHALPRVRGLPGRQVNGQAHESHVPPDPDRAGTELGPLLVIHMGDVLKNQLGPALRPGHQLHLDPAPQAAAWEASPGPRLARIRTGQPAIRASRPASCPTFTGL